MHATKWVRPRRWGHRPKTKTLRVSGEVQVYDKQLAFLRSTAAVRGFTAGIGAGKSWVGAYDLIRRAVGRPGLYMVTAPTYKVLRDASFRTFRDVATSLNLYAGLHKSEFMARLVGGSEVIFRSADAPDNLRGPNLSGIWGDEASYTEEEAFIISVGRLREGGQLGWYSLTFTPNGRAHWTYDILGREPRRPDTFLVRAATGESPFLPPNFENTIRGQYTTRTARQELDGEFLEMAGALFSLEWLPLIDAAPIDLVKRVRAWDLAATEQKDANDPDYTAGVLMGKTAGGRYVVLDVIRERKSPLAVKQLINAVADRDGKSVEIWIEQEGGAGGKSWAQELVTSLAGYNAHVSKPTTGKVERANPFAAQAEAGNVRLVRGAWCDAFVDELISFPGKGHDDQCDAASMGFAKLADRRAAFDVR